MVGSLLMANAVPVAADSPFEGNDIKELREELRGTGVHVDWKKPPPVQSQGDQNRPPKIGDARVFLALDDVRGIFYLKFFTLRGTSKDAELWVANNINFPNPSLLNPLTADPTDTFTYNDCRNDGVRNVISDAQVAYLLQQFSNNIRPTDTSWFGEPAVRRGDSAPLVDLLNGAGIPTHKNAYRNPAGRDVILVDNVRDDNWYDQNNEDTNPYIAGFFSGTLSFYTQRNVMTIDAFDWVHRTGANPPHSPSTDPCLSMPARPFLYESVFAHEYQHLIHADYDGDELSWVNEGMSDFAEILTGYNDPSLHVDEMGYDSHTQGFLGWLSVFHADWNSLPDDTGPENSLTVWEDQPGPAEIFEDYGFAYFFMTYMQSQGYGQSFFTAWHHNQLNSIAGLNDTLAAFGSSDTFDSLFRDIVASVLVDGYIDNGASVTGAPLADLQNSATEATVFFNAAGDANDTPGAPPYGSDYIQLGPGAGLASVSFDGADSISFPGGPQWIVEAGYWTTPDGAGNPYAANLDSSIAREVTVPGAGILTFNHYYQTEATWDFGFVQISTDGGLTWTSQPCTGTSDVHDPQAAANIAENMPGFSGPDQTGAGYVGSAGSPVGSTCDLPTGTFLLAFRMMSDAFVEFDGWFVNDVRIDGALVDDDPEELSDWTNIQFFNPLDFGWFIQLVGLTGTVDAYGDIVTGGNVVIVRPTLGAGNTWVSSTELAALAGSTQVVAIITALSPENDQTSTYPSYSLMVNGAEMADGQNPVL
jgi:hypothetical protein